MSYAPQDDPIAALHRKNNTDHLDALDPNQSFPDSLPRPCMHSKEELINQDAGANRGNELSLATKPFLPSQAQRDLVRQMAGHGLSPAQIRFYIKDGNCRPISLGTFLDNFFQEFADGLNGTSAMLGARLLQMANQNKNPIAAVRAIELFLRCKVGWKDTQVLELQGPGGESTSLRSDDERKINDRVRELLDTIAASKAGAVDETARLAREGAIDATPADG